MKKLAVSSGTVVYELNNQVVVARKPSRWTTTFMFVTGLITMLAFVNGAIQILLHPGSPVSYTVTAIGVIFGIPTFLVYKHRKKVNRIPWNELEVLCRFDHATGKVLDANGQAICGIGSARLQRKMQLTSSSPQLVLIAGGQTIRLVKGSPLSGGVSAVHKTLLEKALNVNK